MKTFITSRTAIVIATLAVAIALAACGGGGTDTESSVSALSAASKEPIAQADSTSASRQLVPQRFATASSTVFGGIEPMDAANQLLDFAEVNFPQFFPSHQGTHVSGPFVFRFYPELGTYVAVTVNTTPGDGLSEGGVYVLGGPFGNSIIYIAPMTMFVTPTAVPDWWRNVSITPMGVKVSGFHELSGFSTLIGDAAWQQTVQNGTIKVVDTNSLMSGFSNRPIAWTAFTEGTTYCTTPVYKSDSGAIGSFTRPGSACNSEAFDWVVGTKDGIIRHFTARNQCFQLQWDITIGTFNDFLIPCP